MMSSVAPTLGLQSICFAVEGEQNLANVTEPHDLRTPFTPPARPFLTLKYTVCSPTTMHTPKW